MSHKKNTSCETSTTCSENNVFRADDVCKTLKIKTKREENKMTKGYNLKVTRSPNPVNPRRIPTDINNHEQQPKRACGDKTHPGGGPSILISRGPGGKITCDIRGPKCSHCPHR